MAASQSLLQYLESLGMTPEQIQALLAAAGGTDGNTNENAVAAAAARYAAALAQGQLNAPTVTNPGGGTTTPPTTPPATPGGSTGPGGFPLGPNGPFPPPANSPPQGPGAVPYGTGSTPQESGAYWQQVVANMLSGSLTPQQQFPYSAGMADSMSPEKTLPGAAYAGTVGASVLTPEQAAQIAYNTPELQQFLAGASGTDVGYGTVNNLTNAYRSNSYAGNPADLNAAISTSTRAVYDDFLLRSGQIEGRPGVITYQDFVNGMGAFKNTTGNQPTLEGAQLAPSIYPAQGGAYALYGPGPAPTSAGPLPAGASAFLPAPYTPVGTLPGPGGVYANGPGGGGTSVPSTTAAAAGPTPAYQPPPTAAIAPRPPSSMTQALR